VCILFASSVGLLKYALLDEPQEKKEMQPAAY